MSTEPKSLSEGALQSRCFTQHWNNYPHLRKRFCCINNNAQNSLKGALNKAIGVIAGVSDTFYLLPAGKVLWLEFKIPGGYQSKAQKEWQVICEQLGHSYQLIWNEDDFWSAIGLEKPNV